MHRYDALAALAFARENFSKFATNSKLCWFGVFEQLHQPRDGARCSFTADMMTYAFANPAGSVLRAIDFSPDGLPIALSRQDCEVSHIDALLDERKLVKIAIDPMIADESEYDKYEGHELVCFRLSPEHVVLVDSFVNLKDMEVRTLDATSWASFRSALEELKTAPTADAWRRIANVALPAEAIAPRGYACCLWVYELDTAMALNRLATMMQYVEKMRDIQ